jgi:hypothetical protein
MRFVAVFLLMQFLALPSTNFVEISFHFELAAFPLTVGAIGQSGAVEGVGADFAGDYFPGSAVFIGFGKA